MLTYFEIVCDSHININYKINYSGISIMGFKVWNRVQSYLQSGLSVLKTFNKNSYIKI